MKHTLIKNIFLYQLKMFIASSVVSLTCTATILFINCCSSLPRAKGSVFLFCFFDLILLSFSLRRRTALHYITKHYHYHINFCFLFSSLITLIPSPLEKGRYDFTIPNIITTTSTFVFCSAASSLLSLLL